MSTAAQRIAAARPWIEQAGRKLGPPQQGSVAWMHQQALEALTAAAVETAETAEGDPPADGAGGT